MNTNIKELAEKAGFMDSWFSESGDDCETEIKAFAELIVKECLRNMENEDGDLDFAIWKTKKDFGVE